MMMNHDWFDDMLTNDLMEFAESQENFEKFFKDGILDEIMESLDDIVVKKNGVVLKFKDGQVFHAEAHNDDEFSLETGLVWCWLKFMVGDSGIANKLVKASEEFINEKARKREEEKRRIRNRKKIAKEAEQYIKSLYSAADAFTNAFEKELKEEQIELQKEAFLRAMREWNTEQSGKKDDDTPEVTAEVDHN